MVNSSLRVRDEQRAAREDDERLRNLVMKRARQTFCR